MSAICTSAGRNGDVDLPLLLAQGRPRCSASVHNNLINVQVDLQARMTSAARSRTTRLPRRIALRSIAVVAVIGSTEESAVDPLREILDRP